MKKLLLACVAMVTLAAPAFAADLAVKTPQAPPPAIIPPPLFTWTGLYLGINGGGAWAHETWTDNDVFSTGGTLDPRGGVFGGQFGYRWQWSQVVFGVEGTWDWAGLSQSVSNASYTDQLKVTSIWTVTGQLGLAAIDRALIYVKGGYAGASTNSSSFFNTPGGGGGTNSQTSSGWTVGVGADYAVTPNVVLGVEYDHIDLNYGTIIAPWSTGGGPWVVSATSRLTIDQVVGRLSYKFNAF